MIKASHMLAEQLKHISLPKWASEVHAYANLCNQNEQSALCNWGCTVKTHKAEGCVSIRPIHAATGHCFNALSEIVNRLLTPMLKNLSHIAWSSEDVQKHVAEAKVSTSSILMKFDVKELYLAGEHEQLSSRASRLLEGSTAKWARDCLDVILGEQFVRFRPETGSNLQVVRGSGMGMRHSGSVSDAAFHDLVEIDLLSETSRKDNGVELYVRFRDDILVVLANPKFCTGFFSKLISLASSMYEVERECFSLVSTTMLDLRVYKTAGSDGITRLRWKPYIKPTARHVPLTSDSCHPRSCHRAWPVAEIGRMHVRSCRATDFGVFRDLKIGRFARFFLSGDVLADCESWKPRVQMQRSLESGTKCRVIRLVLPFSERWRGISNELRTLKSKWAASFARLGFNIDVGICFAKGTRALFSLVR
jgi:hypothetical protein